MAVNHCTFQSHLLNLVVEPRESERRVFHILCLLVVEATGRSPLICVIVKQRTFIL